VRDRRHRMHDGLALPVIEYPEQVGDFTARAAVEFGKGGAAFCGQRQLAGTAVGLGWPSGHDLAALQGLQRAAEEAGVEAKRASQVGRGAALALRDLVDDAGFLQRPRTAQELWFDDAQLARVEAVEASDGGDLTFQRWIGDY